MQRIKTEDVNFYGVYFYESSGSGSDSESSGLPTLHIDKPDHSESESDSDDSAVIVKSEKKCFFTFNYVEEEE